MSQTQSPVEEIEQDRASGDNEQHADAPAQDDDMSHRNDALDYDFEVKEQDRWLPIANGKCVPVCVISSLPAPTRRFHGADTLVTLCGATL